MIAGNTGQAGALNLRSNSFYFSAPMLKPCNSEENKRQAMCRAAAQLDAAESRAQPGEMSQALADVARCCRALDDWPSAETCLVHALRWARLAGSTDGVVDLMCELSETSTSLAERFDADEDMEPGPAHAARERARDHAFEASTLAGRVADTQWEVQVLLRISDVLDRCGDRDDAMLLQTRALRLMSGGLCAALDVSHLPSLGRLADA